MIYYEETRYINYIKRDSTQFLRFHLRRLY